MATQAGVIEMCEDGVNNLDIEGKIRYILNPNRERMVNDAERLIADVHSEMCRIKEQSYSEVSRLRAELENKDAIIKGLAGYIRLTGR